MALVLSNISATAPSSILTVSPPAYPDFVHCHSWYSSPVASNDFRYEDCITALKKLPRGNESISWYSNGMPPGLPSEENIALPLAVREGMCEIKISMSGKYVIQDKKPLRIDAVPDDIYNTALYTIDTCLGQKHKGGYSTLQFSNTSDWITAPDTIFPGTLDLPASITFFTALVWNPDPEFEDVEPGSDGERTALELDHALETAIDKAETGSALQRDLKARWEYIQGSEWSIRWYGKLRRVTWWSGPSMAPPPSNGGGCGSGSAGLVGTKKKCSERGAGSGVRKS